MKKKIITSVCAVILLALALGICSALVVPKYTEAKRLEGRLSGEYYAEAGDHDVLFIGDCEVYESFIPAVLWQEYGISSYVRGTPSQLAWQSYYILEDTFRYETPKVVVYNVQALVNGESEKNEAMNRMALDGMKWSVSKVKAINASMTDEENFLDYVFPLLRYHSRITELTADDFKYAFNAPAPVSHSGYLMQKGVAPMTEEASSNDKYVEPMPDETMEYLEKMRLLCEEKGSKLVLVKAPTNSSRYWWHDEWEDEIVSYANKNKLSYYNFIPLCEEMGIDWATDTYDKGEHLNVYGAEKYTKYFGKILAENHGVADKRDNKTLNKLWQARVNKYNEAKN